MFRRKLAELPASHRAIRLRYQETRQQADVLQDRIAEKMLRNVWLNLKEHGNPPSRKKHSLFRGADALKFAVIPKGIQSGGASALGIVGHSVAADELPSLGREKPYAWVANLEMLRQPFKCGFLQDQNWAFWRGRLSPQCLKLRPAHGWIELLIAENVLSFRRPGIESIPIARIIFIVALAKLV